MSSNGVRLLPALVVTMGVVLSLKAAALAEEASGALPAASTPASPDKAEAKDQTLPAGALPADAGATIPSTLPAQAAQAAPAPTCAAPSFAEAAGLSQAEVRVLQSLGDRRKELDAREDEMRTRGDVLTAAEKRVAERVAELKKLQGSVEVLLGKLDAQEEQRINDLVVVYSKMRAKDAALVFEGLDDDVLVEVAGRMKQPILAEIMGKMTPPRARQLTTLLIKSKKQPASVAAAGQRAPPPAKGG